MAPQEFLNSLVRTSLTHSNDFYFAGKAKVLTDETTIKTFPSLLGYIMKAKL